MMLTTDPGNKELAIAATRHMGFFKAEEGRGLNDQGKVREAENSLNTAGVCLAIVEKLQRQPANVIDLEAWELGIVVANLRNLANAKTAQAADDRAKLKMDATAWDHFSAQVCNTLADMLDARLSKVH